MKSIRVKRLVQEAVLPKKAHASDAGFDLVAVSCKVENGMYVYGTGLAFEIPEGYVGLIFPRSSIAKKDLILSNSVGVIDSGYRGEVTAKFHQARRMFEMSSDEFPAYRIGDRIGQLVIVKLPEFDMVEADELSESDRGTGGYGSTGR